MCCWLTGAWWLEVPEAKALHVLHKSPFLLRAGERCVLAFIPLFRHGMMLLSALKGKQPLQQSKWANVVWGDCSAGPDPPHPGSGGGCEHLLQAARNAAAIWGVSVHIRAWLNLSSMKHEQACPSQNTSRFFDIRHVWRGRVEVFVFIDSTQASTSA